MDWLNDDYAEAYYELFKSNFGNIAKQSPWITLEMFKSGFFMMMIELSDSVRLFNQADVWSKVSPGSICISGTFATPLRSSVEFVYCGWLYDQVILLGMIAFFLNLKIDESKW